jgi:CRISPR-associated protein Csm1
VDKWWRGLETFGLNVWAVDTSREPPNASDRYVRLADGARLVDVTRLNHDRAKHHERLMGELTQNGLPVINTFRPFAQLVPTDRYGNPLTFDQLAERSTGGVKRWGVLRLDVDNLGQLFETGFRRRQNGQAENRLTISRLAGLSFALRLFFEGWLPRLGESGERLAERLYVQYAGGDDLFVVGSWDALPEFAAVIRGSFQDFVCHNPYVTLSGGVTLAPEKYPLYQAARDAERAEHAAKAFNRPAQAANGRPTDKDAFCFLGQVVGWEAFEPVRERAYQLAGWCGDEGQVSRALLQTLLSIHVEHRRGREQALEKKQWRPGQIYFGPWMWHLAYHLARRIQDKRTPPEVKEDLAALETEMLASPANIETIGLAARWAQFLIRK